MLLQLMPEGQPWASMGSSVELGICSFPALRGSVETGNQVAQLFLWQNHKGENGQQVSISQGPDEASQERRRAGAILSLPRRPPQRLGGPQQGDFNRLKKLKLKSE